MDARSLWIMTRRAGYNFGTSLQAYALQWAVEQAGYPSQIVDYREYRRRALFRLGVLRCLDRVLGRLPRGLRGRLPEPLRALRGFDAQCRAFDRFEREQLRLTVRRYSDTEALQREAEQPDVALCGSDQIWSPLLFDPAYLLAFAGERTRKIAYAPSFGVEQVTEHREAMARLIARFDRLSVREQRGVELVGELTGRAAELVCDPTLLLTPEHWSGLATPPPQGEPYILSYFLSGRVPVDYLRRLQEQTGWRVVELETNYFRPTTPGFEHWGAVGPKEFLGAVAGAAAVCTNSFHGTCFALLFRRPFHCFARFAEDDRRNQNSRIRTLLAKLGARDRLVAFDRPEPLADLIDFEAIEERLDAWRACSLDYLRSALTLPPDR